MQKIEIGSRYPLPKPEMMIHHSRSRREGAGTFTKTLLVVKLTILLLTAAFLNVHANSKAQTVTLSGKDLTLKQVFAAIEKQTDYLAFYNQQILLNTKTVSLTVYDMPLVDLLKTVLKDQPLDFTIQGKTIILSRKKVDDNPDKPLTIFPPKIEVFAPPVTGRILGPDGTPLSGVTIVIRGSGKGTSTLANGAFSLEVKEGDLLEISSIGYTMVTIQYTGGDFKLVTPATQKKGLKENTTGKLLVTAAHSFTVQMMRSSSPLDEVQITAYGKTSRRLATGNIGMVTAEEIERQPVMTVLEAMIGKVPGVNIQRTSGNSASAMRVTIRGINTINSTAITDPLYVIDGIPFTTLNASPTTGAVPISMGPVQGGNPNTIGENPLMGINMRDIESVSVLKDADATAIYGSRGANGVILITTKRPKAGPTNFRLSVNQGITMLSRYPKMLNTQEYLAMRREAFRNDGIIPDQGNAPDLVRWDTTKYTDWQRLFVGTGSATSVNANVSGGTSQTSYSISAGYNNRKELMNNGGKNHAATLFSSFNHTSLNQKFGFSLGNNLSLTEVNAFRLGDQRTLAPNAPDIYNEKGEFNFEPYRQQNGSSFPFKNLKKPSESNTFALQGSMNIKYEIIRGLTISTNAGYNFSHNTNANYSPEAAEDPMYLIPSSAIFGESVNKNWMVEPQLRYNTFIGKGNLSIQLIGNLNSIYTRGETIFADQFPNDAMMKSYNNAIRPLRITEGVRQRKSVSGIAIVKYVWDNKYVINLNARRDGSSQFGPGKQFGNFASVGLAWIASDEKWLRNIMPQWFSFFKVRGSHGITGGDNVGDYEYLSRWSKSATISGAKPLYKYNGLEAFHVLKPLNQQYQWESTVQSELGVEMAFLQNRITMGISVYRKISDNQLTELPMPILTGFPSVVANSEAKISNSGIELMLSANLISTADWGLNVNFNLGRNRNKLLAFPNLEKSSYRDRLKIGESLSSVYYLKFTGIDPLTGNPTFEDRNKDGLITVGAGNFPQSDIDDRYIPIDFTTPKFEGGFGINFNYKDLSISTSFMFINKMRANPYFVSIGGEANIVLPDEIKYNHWQKPGDQAKYPKYTTGSVGFGNVGRSDVAYVNGSFLRMTNLTLAYRFPAKWLKKIRMKDANFSIQTQNLFAISPYRGLDPDAQFSIYASPIPRTIATQLSFNF